MDFKKLSILLVAGVSLLTSCNDENKKQLMVNSDYLLYQNIEDDRLMYTPSLSEFESIYNSNLNFIVLFSDPGCSACQAFQPIIEKYIKETHQFVLLVDGPDQYKIQNAYKDKFFPNSGVKTPSLFVKENNNQIYQVDYNSYMKTYRVFKKHMNSRYKTGKYSCFAGDFHAKTPITSDFSYIECNVNETYQNKLFPLVESSNKNIIFSFDNGAEKLTSYHVEKSGELTIKNQTDFNENITQEELTNYL